MRRLFFCLLCLFLLATPVAPAAPAARADDVDLFLWTLTLGDDGVMLPADLIAASDGGAFIVGSLTGDNGFGEPLGERDAFMLRVDADGNVRWLRRFGGSGEDGLTRVLETPDGGCVAIGVTNSTDGDARSSRGGLDAFVVRVTPSGETVFTKCLGGTLDDELLDIALCGEDRYIVCGRTQSRNGDLRANNGGWDAWAALLEADTGKPLWVARDGKAGDDQFTRVLPTDGGWLLLGVLAEEGEGYPEAGYQQRPFALMLAQTDDGKQEEQWKVMLGGYDVNQLHEVIAVDNGWVFIGETNSTSVLMPQVRGGLDIWMLHLRTNGTMAWQRTYGGSADDRVSLVRPLPDGGYALLGTTYSSDGQVQGSHGDRDLWLIRAGQTGLLEWQQALGGSSYSSPAGLLLTADGGFLVAGTSTAQDGDIGRHASRRTGFLCRLASNGNLLWTRLVGGDAECSLLALCASDDAAYVLGTVQHTEDADARLFVGRLAIEGLRSE